MYTCSETVFTGVSENEENDKIIASIARYTAEPVQAESEGVLSFCTSVYKAGNRIRKERLDRVKMMQHCRWCEYEKKK